MRYHELSQEDKEKYGKELFELTARRKKLCLGADRIEDYVLVDSGDGSRVWIFYPDIDD